MGAVPTPTGQPPERDRSRHPSFPPFMKPQNKATKRTTKPKVKPAAKPKAPAKATARPAAKTVTKAAAKKPAKPAAKKPAKPAASTRREKAAPNGCCDDAANEELGIKAAMPPPPKFRGAGAAPKAGSTGWRAAKSLTTLKDQVNAKAPSRNKSHDGMIGDVRHRSRASDHNPWVDGGVVTAYDITNDPAKNCDVNKLAEAIRTTREPRVKYLIWKRRICNHASVGGAAAWAWRPYGGSNPHDKHLHISVKETKAHYDSTAPWPV